MPVYGPVGPVSTEEAADESKEFADDQTLSNVQDILVEGKYFRVVDGSLLFGSDTQVAVFAVTGQVIFSGMTQSVQLPQAGVYVVRTEKGTAKIGVR